MRGRVASGLAHRTVRRLDTLDALQVRGTSRRRASALVVERALGLRAVGWYRTFVIRAHQAECAITLLILDPDHGAVGR